MFYEKKKTSDVLLTCNAKMYKEYRYNAQPAEFIQPIDAEMCFFSFTWLDNFIILFCLCNVPALLGSAIFTLITTGTQMDRDSKCNINLIFFSKHE